MCMLIVYTCKKNAEQISEHNELTLLTLIKRQQYL